MQGRGSGQAQGHEAPKAGQLHQCGMNVSSVPPQTIDELSLSANNGKAKLREAGAGVGLAERQQCSDNVVPNEISNGKLHAVVLLPHAATGSASVGRWSWEQRNLG